MTDWLNPQTFISILALLGGLISAYVAWRKEKREAPIDTTNSAVANANAVTDTAVGAFKDLSDRLSVVENAVQKWDAWYHDLVIGWDAYKKEPLPPAPPQSRQA